MAARIADRLVLSGVVFVALYAPARYAQDGRRVVGRPR